MAEVELDVADGVATITLNRPEQRNALSVSMIRGLAAAVSEADGREDVGAIVLTGAGPAFCAGLDLKELGRDGGALMAGGRAGGPLPAPLPARTTPLIGAVNGVAVTGGLELALNCDWLVASDRARFADTHARVGVQPLWGLTVLLPQAVGIRRAREMSATGNFVDAGTALAWGLVNHVVPHHELLDVTRRLAADVVSNDARALATLFDTYVRGSRVTAQEALAIEAQVGLAWRDEEVSPDRLERRRGQVIDRGRAQT